MNPIETFAKQVKSPSVTRKSISDDSTISKIVNVLGKLEGQSKAVTSLVEDLGLKTNPKKWVQSLLSGYPLSINSADAENLLIDFTESMQTRMRMDTKYALALIVDNRVFLAHSVYGQETITPDWRILPRMLDIDNVLRFAAFFESDGELEVKYWERNATSSFAQWLGLPRKQAYQFGGKFRILSSIEGATIELQLTEDEVESWIDRHPELSEGKIAFASPVHGLSVEEIRSGSKSYDHAGDFIQDFEAQKKGLPRYQHEYETISSKTAPMFVKYYDEKHQLAAIHEDQISVEVEKSTPGIEIIFADGIIAFRSSYLEELVSRVSHGDEVNIFHAAHDFRIKPVEIGRLSIYNKLKVSEVAEAVLDYIQEVQIQDRQLENVLKLAAILTLSSSNSGSPIGFTLDELARGILKDLEITGILGKLEDGIVEYKSREVLAGSNEEVIDGLAQDLSGALKDQELALHLIGVDDDGAVDPVPSNRITSDRLDTIRKGLASELGTDPPHIAPLSAGNGAVVMICSFKKS